MGGKGKGKGMGGDGKERGNLVEWIRHDKYKKNITYLLTYLLTYLRKGLWCEWCTDIFRSGTTVWLRRRFL